MELNHSGQYCLEQVHRLDHERFLTALFAPAEKRPALFALYAFNIELARIRTLVSEPILGDIRLQWWRETVEALYAGVTPGHDLGPALQAAISTHDLPQEALLDLIDARALDLADEPPAGWAMFEDYIDRTSGTVMRLAAQVLAGPLDAPAQKTIRSASLAYGLTGLLRSLPLDAAHGRYLLPLALLEKHGLDPHDFFGGRMKPGMAGLLADGVARARHHLAAARAARGALPRRAYPAVLPASLIRRPLALLSRPGFDPFRHSTDVPGYRQQLRLLLQSARGRF